MTKKKQSAQTFDWDEYQLEVMNEIALELAASGLDPAGVGSALARIYLSLPEGYQAIDI